MNHNYSHKKLELTNKERQGGGSHSIRLTPVRNWCLIYRKYEKMKVKGDNDGIRNFRS